MKKSVLAIFALVAILVAGCGSGEEVELRLKPKEGDKYKVKMNMDMTMDAMMMQMDMNIGMDYSMEVNNVAENGDVSFATVFEDMRFDVDGLDGILGGSDELSGLMGNNPLEAVIGKEMSMVLSSRNGIIESPDLGEYLDDAQGMDADQMDRFYEQMFAFYPEEAVAVGAEWDAKYKVEENGMNMTVKTIYTVSEITDEMVKGDVGGEVTGSGLAEVSGKIEGHMNINREDGMVTEVVLDQMLEMSIMGLGTSINTEMDMTCEKQ